MHLPQNGRSEIFGLRDTSNTYLGHLRYISSSYMAVSHKPKLICSYICINLLTFLKIHEFNIFRCIKLVVQLKTLLKGLAIIIPVTPVARRRLNVAWRPCSAAGARLGGTNYAGGRHWTRPGWPGAIAGLLGWVSNLATDISPRVTFARTVEIPVAREVAVHQYEREAWLIFWCFL